MAIGDDTYSTDTRGRGVLLGLSFAETAEFLRLETAIADPDVFISMIADDWRSPAERRWLSLYEKHLVALQLRHERSRPQ